MSLKDIYKTEGSCNILILCNLKTQTNLYKLKKRGLLPKQGVSQNIQLKRN